MKILITVPFSKKGGVFVFTENILPFFQNKFVFKRGADENANSLINTLRTISIPVRFLYCLIFSKSTHVLVNTSLSKFNIFRDGFLVAFSRLFGRKVLLFIHGFNASYLSSKTILNLGFFKADNIIVLSNDFKNELSKYYDKKHIHVLPNPINISYIEKNINKVEKKCEDRVKLLFLSRLIKEKGGLIVIETLKKLVTENINIELHIAGDGVFLDELKKYVSDQNLFEFVTFHGHVGGEVKTELLEKCDILFLPSYCTEGLPITILEAMVFGLVIITRSEGGIVDLHNNCNFGYMSKSKDPEVFSNAIKDIISNKAQMNDIKKQNRVYALEFFNPKAIANNINQILSTL
jgi:glycosyltransferase involved in cell wall biosynthesis